MEGTFSDLLIPRLRHPDHDTNTCLGFSPHKQIVHLVCYADANKKGSLIIRQH